VVIVDAGGGTVDISSYSRNQKGNFEEIAAPQCSFSFFTLKIANFRSMYTRSLPRLCFCDLPCKTVFREYVVAKFGPLSHYIIGEPLCLGYLKGSPFLDELEYIVCCFDKTTKLRFRNAEEPEYVKFGSTKDNDKSYNIRLGQLKLMG
jgi:hypothetical protein